MYMAGIATFWKKKKLYKMTELGNYKILLLVHRQVNGQNLLVQPKFTCPKIEISLFLEENICCGYSLEVPGRKHMLWVLIRSASQRLIAFANSLDQNQARQNVGPDLDPNCLTFWWYSWQIFLKKFILEKNPDYKKECKIIQHAKG